MSVYYPSHSTEIILDEILKHKQKCVRCGESYFIAYIEMKQNEAYGVYPNNANTFCPFCGGKAHYNYVEKKRRKK